MDGDRRVSIGEASLEVETLGEGQPVVVIQTALDAHELRPLAQRLAASGRHRVIHYHRRGYAGSDPVVGRSSIARDAADCRALIAALGVAPAHVVGASYSAAVALTLASSAPESVRTLTAIEPPPVEVPSAPEFRGANARLQHTYRRHGSAAALDEFMTTLVGLGWRQERERDHPGSAGALERDAVTFFEHDVPALLSWQFGTEEAAAVRCPVLYLGGSESGPWFAEVRTRVLDLLPGARAETVAGSGHLLASTHPAETARLVLDFLGHHA
jgi:pimeloyl-ACP methyl ester carboxylesterase